MRLLELSAAENTIRLRNPAFSTSVNIYSAKRHMTLKNRLTLGTGVIEMTMSLPVETRFANAYSGRIRPGEIAVTDDRSCCPPVLLPQEMKMEERDLHPWRRPWSS
jgi:hypothetical protein